MPNDLRTACIVIDDDAPNYGSSAPLQIAGQPILARQAHALRAAGFSSIILLGQGPRARFLAQTAALPPDAVMATLGDVSHVIADEESVLLMGEGCLPSGALLHLMCSHGDGVITVRDAATSDDRHERIDLNDRFAGLLILPNSIIRTAPAADADWNPLSLLLRHAVQLKLPRFPIPIGPMEAVRCDMIGNSEDAIKWELRMIEAQVATQAQTASPLERWLLLPLIQRTLTTQWLGKSDVFRYLPYATLALGALAFVLAWLAWPIAALLMLLFAFVSSAVSNQAQLFASESADGGDLQWAFVALTLGFAPWATFWAESALPNLAALFAGAVVSLAFLQPNGSATKPAGALGPLEAVVFAAVALSVGLDIGVTALGIAILALAQTVWRPMLTRLKTI